MDKPLAAALKEARKRLSLSICQLAKRSGMYAGTLWRWENGQRPTLVQLPLIAKAYGLPEELIAQLRMRKRASPSAPIPISNGRPLFSRL